MICTCQRCGRSLDPPSCDLEYQEALIISFRAGYGSVFGDGNLVESTLCQYCLQQLLGPWLSITEDDPFEPKHRARHLPQGAYQPNQTAQRQAGMPVPSQSELKQLFSQQRNEDT